MVKNPCADAGVMGSIPGSGRSPGGGNGNSLQVFLPGESHGERGPCPPGCPSTGPQMRWTLLAATQYEQQFPFMFHSDNFLQGITLLILLILFSLFFLEAVFFPIQQDINYLISPFVKVSVSQKTLIFKNVKHTFSKENWIVCFTFNTENIPVWNKCVTAPLILPCGPPLMCPRTQD